MNHHFTKIKRLVPWTIMNKNFSIKSVFKPFSTKPNLNVCKQTLNDVETLKKIYFLGLGISYFGFCSYGFALDTYEWSTEGETHNHTFCIALHSIPVVVLWPLICAGAILSTPIMLVGGLTGYVWYRNNKRLENKKIETKKQQEQQKRLERLEQLDRQEQERQANKETGERRVRGR